MPQTIRLGLVQMAMGALAEENRRKAGEMVHDAAEQGADIVCLPELFTTPYFCNIENAGFGFAESVPGPTSEFLAELSKECRVTLIGGSLHEKAGDRYFNTSLIFGPDGKQLGMYRKTHIPHDDSFFEQHYFQPGDTGFRIFETDKAKLGVLICYDQWFPEAARSEALLGADIVFYPTAIGTVTHLEQTEGNWQEAWENVMRGHAIANNMIVAAVNRVGSEGESRFWGGSFVCDAFGKTLVRAGEQEEIVIATVDLAHSKLVREGWRFFHNRRPDTYRLLIKDK